MTWLGQVIIYSFPFQKPFYLCAHSVYLYFFFYSYTIECSLIVYKFTDAATLICDEVQIVQYFLVLFILKLFHSEFILALLSVEQVQRISPSIVWSSIVH